MIEPNKISIIDKCLDQTDLVLRQLMDNMFDHLDDEIFAHAEEVKNNNTQQLFFDAMRQVHRQRNAIIGVFLNTTISDVSAFLNTRQTHFFTPSDKASSTQEAVGLSLLDHSDLEEGLGVSRVVAVGEEVFAPLLSLLNNLLGSFTNRQILSNTENPLAPDALSNAFKLALSGWQGELEVKLVVYELFGKYVIAELGDHYQQVVDILLRAGVQPLTPSISAQSSEAAPAPVKQDPEYKSAANYMDATSAPASANTQESAKDLSAGSFFSLVSLVHGLLDSNRSALGLPHVPAAVGFEQPAMRPSDVVSALGQMTEQLQTASPFDLQGAKDKNKTFKHDLLRNLTQNTTGDQRQLHVVDQHVVDVLMLMFDFVLDDPAMPDPMKVLLSRLQMPLLQTALQDKKFMVDKSHPARALLNKLSRSAIRWSDNGDYSETGLFGAIEKTINQILSGAGLNGSAVFVEADQAFSHWLERYARGARISEERLGQVAKGQEQLTQARNSVSDALAKLLNDQIPVAVYKILDGPWRDVLTLVQLREGYKSSSWNKAIDVAQRMIESTTPQYGGKQQQEMMHHIPLLLGDLREGFTSISYDSARSSSLLKELQLCHVLILKGMQPELRETTSSAADGASINSQQMAKDEFDELAATVKMGSWISWKVDDQKLRAKLSWRSEISDVLLFVDSRGRKVVEMTTPDLADLLRRDDAHVLYEVTVPMMDRAMQVVHSALRKAVPDSSATLSA